MKPVISQWFKSKTGFNTLPEQIREYLSPEDIDCVIVISEDMVLLKDKDKLHIHCIFNSTETNETWLYTNCDVCDKSDKDFSVSTENTKTYKLGVF